MGGAGPMGEAQECAGHHNAHQEAASAHDTNGNHVPNLAYPAGNPVSVGNPTRGRIRC